MRRIVRFKLAERLKSFKYAFNGLRILLISEHNSRIHFVVAVLAVVIGLLTGFSAHEWIAVLIVTALVFITEIFNTAIEYISDFVSPEYNETIKKIKDLAAAGVLIAAITAVLVACMILVPKIISLFS